MDCMLPKAQSLKIPEKHIGMSVEATKELLEKYALDEKTKETIINCVEAHHGTKEYLSLEAEICANADCYKFIHPKGVLAFSSILGRRFHDMEKELTQLEYKLDEKFNTLSLEITKEELTEYYNQFKKMIELAKK
jgi:hypothetical protein